MTRPLRLMAVMAHPDDESFAVGGTLARYAAEGISVHLVTATTGQRGRYFNGDDRPSDDEVGRVREAELREAANALGIADVHLLEYQDGSLDQVDAPDAVRRIADRMHVVQPHVVITLDPFGVYGHPDHVAISQLTTAAVVAAAAPMGNRAQPHRVLKLYYTVMDPPRWQAMLDGFDQLAERIEGRERDVVLWPEWSVSAQVDASAHWEAAWSAIRCHRSQTAIYGGLDALSEAQHRVLWGRQPFYRAFSLVETASETEADLFAGLW